MSDEQRISRTASTILRYVHRHPQACDTLEGIHGWWLRRQHFDDTLQDVRVALDRLVGEGVLTAEAGKDGRVMYRRAGGQVDGSDGRH